MQTQVKTKQPELKVNDKASELKAKTDLVGEVIQHYDDARAELDTRITHSERGFDVYDRVYRNYINPKKWPYNARVADGKGSSLLKRKTDRLLATKLQGRMIPTKAGTELGAKIATELILHEWNEIDMKSDEPMIMRWRRKDLNTRKYGAAFAFVPWRRVVNFKGQVTFDGPWFEVLDNRDVLTQPGSRSIFDSEWIQVRRYVTIRELKTVNDVATTGPIYDPEAIKQLSQKEGSSDNYTSVNKDIMGLTGPNSDNKKIEVVTEYRMDRWITFVPKQGTDKGIVLRDIANPYDHGEIPIIRLVYDVIDDDIYGVPELENVMPLIKGGWALLSQYLEGVQNELYTELMVNPKNVQLDTLEFKAGARWLMERPGQDVVPFKGGNIGLQRFSETFGLITSLIMEGIGETAQDISNISQTFGDKTATEVKDLALLRTARDNANKLLLSAAMSKMVYFWHKMNQQYMEGYRLVRIVGTDAVKYLIEEGLHNWTINDEGAEIVSKYASENGVEFDEAYNQLLEQGQLEQYAIPLYPINAGDDQQVPQLQLEKDGRSGFLAVSGKDIEGDYDFVPDIEAMSLPNDQTDVAARRLIFGMLKEVEGQIANEGFKIKWKELIEKIGESSKVRDIEQYFEQFSKEDLTNMANNQMGASGGAPQGQEVPQNPPVANQPK